MELYFKFRFYIEIISYILLAVLIAGIGLIALCIKIYEFIDKRFGKEKKK